MFSNICEAISREMRDLDQKYRNGAQLSMQDLEHIDLMSHALKSLATYDAMVGNDSSYSRWRNRVTGRYVNREEDYGERY